MIKKIVVAIIVVVVVLFVVLVYVKKEEKLPDSTYKVSMSAVKYEIDDTYTVVADSQTTQSGKIELTHVKASINGGFLQGATGVLDSSDNLMLTGNVYGENAQGWSVTTDTINYTKGSGLISTDSKTVFENKSNGVKITGNSFNAMQNYSQVTLTGDVTLNYQNYTVTCDSATYTNDNTTVTLSGNIRVNGQNITTDKGNISALVGGANGVKINTTTQDMDFFGGYALVADAMSFKGQLLSYNLKSNTGTSLGGTQLSYLKNTLNSQGYTVDLASNKAVLTGPVSGSDNVGTLTASSMTVDANNSQIIGINEVMTRSKGFSISAPSVISDEKSKVTTFKGDGKAKVIAQSLKGAISSDEMIANGSSGDVTIPGNFSFVANLKSKISGTGSNLNYNQNSDTGTADSVTALCNGQTSRADRVNFNFKNGDIEAIGNVVARQGNYILAASDVKFNIATKMMNVVSQFTLSDTVRGYTLTSTHLKYNGNTNLATIQSLITISYKGYLIYGTTLSYNPSTGNGTLAGNVYFTNSTQNINGKTDGQINIVNSTQLQIMGNININDNGSILTTKNAVYNLKTKQGTLPNSGSIVNKTENYSVNFNSGAVDDIAKTVTLNGVSGVNQSMTFSANSAKYTMDSKMLNLTGSVTLQQEGAVLKNDKLTYNTNTEDATFTTPTTITYNTMQVVSSSGVANFSKKSINANNPVLTSTLGDSVKAKNIVGDLSQMQFDFTGGVQGKIIPLTVVRNTKSVNASITNSVTPVTFSSSKASIFLSQVTLQHAKKYVVSRAELQGYAKVEYDSNELKSNFMEFDNFKFYCLAKGKASFKTSKMINENTPQSDTITLEATAQYIKSDLNNQVTTLMYNVKVLNKTKLSGNANITSQEAIIDMKANTITMNGAATLIKGGNTISASKAVYNLTTNSLVGQSNISMKLVTPKN